MSFYFFETPVSGVKMQFYVFNTWFLMHQMVGVKAKKSSFKNIKLHFKNIKLYFLEKK